MAVVGSGDLAIPIKVDVCEDAGVDLGGVDVLIMDRLGAVLRNAEVVVLEVRVGLARWVEVDLLEQDDVGPGALEDFGDKLGLFVIALRELAVELSLSRSA